MPPAGGHLEGCSFDGVTPRAALSRVLTGVGPYDQAARILERLADGGWTVAKLEPPRRERAAEAALARVAELLAEWDLVSKGESPTTRRIREALAETGHGGVRSSLTTPTPKGTTP